VDLTGRDVLIVFLKTPTPGQVKTRLVSVLGAEKAARLYRRLAEEGIRGTTPPRDEYVRVLFHAPASAEAEITAWFPGEALCPQADGDLGDRMAAAFEAVFRDGARRATLIGTDVPWLTSGEMTRALASLDDSDVVLGPAEDGGYYLIGLQCPQPALFRELPWSTPSILAATLERAHEVGLSVHLLPPHRDIDGADDLRAEWPRLRPILARDPDLLVHIEQALALVAR
jgi:rSAM/selenodomain-associated transferase 1